jgi:hypothetical protein
MNEIKARAAAYEKATRLFHRVDIEKIELEDVTDVNPDVKRLFPTLDDALAQLNEPSAVEVVAVFTCEACDALLSVELMDANGEPVVLGPMLGSPGSPFREEYLDDYRDNVCSAIAMNATAPKPN